MFDRAASALAVFTLVTSFSAPLFAQSANDRVYVVQPSDTVSRIAAHLEVPVRALVERNHLTAPYQLRVGRRLRLPDGVPSDILRDLPRRNDPAADTATADVVESRSRHGSDDGGNHSGVVSLVRVRDGAEMTTRFDNPTQALRNRVERFFRYRDGSRHGIHPRLIRLLVSLSSHFDGRAITVLSGFRPQMMGRRGPRTRHSQGYAMDVRIDGVALRELFQWCESQDNLGCGFYPRARFVHIDVRREAASWEDNSQPGTRHASESVPDSDENVSEVMTDAAVMRNAHRGDEN